MPNHSSGYLKPAEPTVIVGINRILKETAADPKELEMCKQAIHKTIFILIVFCLSTTGAAMAAILKSGGGYTIDADVIGGAGSVNPAGGGFTVYESLGQGSGYSISSGTGFEVVGGFIGIVDYTPPSAVVVNDGDGEDIDISNSLFGLSANWSESVDEESAVVGYTFLLGLKSGSTDTTSWISPMTGTGATFMNPFTEGMTYYFSVKAMNGHGLFSEPVDSDGVTISLGPVVDPGDWAQKGTCKKGFTFDVEEMFGSATVQIVQFENGGYVYLPSTGTVAIERGKGFFIISPDSQVVLPDIGTDEMDDTYIFNLKRGWNMFANPFCRPLSWGRVNAELSCGETVQDDLKHRIYHYGQNGEYSAIELEDGYNILPWTAYWIDAPQNGCTLALEEN